MADDEGRMAIRNTVVPIEGYDIAVAAFVRELAHRSEGLES